MALVEDFERGPRSVVQQQLRTPIEEIGFARIKFGGALVLVDGIERITKSFLHVGEQVVNLGRIVMREESLRALASALFVAGIRIGSCEIVRVFKAGGVELCGALKIWNRFTRLSVLD